MECYSEQICAIFVDGELPVNEAQRLRDHLTVCRRCRELVAALRAENGILSESLQEFSEEAYPARSSRWLRPWVWGDLAMMAAVLGLGLIAWLGISDLRVPRALEWLNPFSLSGMTDLFFNLSYYFAHGGTAMLADYAGAIGELFLLLLLGGSALLLGRRLRQRPAGLRLLIVVLVLSLSSFALERRHGEFVNVASNETVDDTLLLGGGTLRLEGVVNGDLLAFGRTLEVRGTVKGDLVSFAKRTVVSGTVEGSIYNLSQSLDLDGQVGHSLYGWVQSLRVDNHAHVGDGILAGGGDISLEGEVKRSVNIATSSADVSGSIGRDLTMAGGALTLTNTARIGGNLNARVRQLRDVHIADGATIAGKRDIQVRVRRNQFAHPRFYFHQAIWLAAAMLVGWLFLMLNPGFFQSSTQAVGSGWRSLGLGFAVLAAVPVAVIVAALTLVGLPVALMLFALYLAAIYLAKIWVGAFLGRALLKPAGGLKRDWLLGLLVGLLILIIVEFVPYLGGLVRFGVICLGLGALAWQLYQASRPRTATPQ